MGAAPGDAEPGGGIVDFASAARAALHDLRERVGMDSWLVARRRGDDYVLLAVGDDDAYGNRPGLVRPWEETFCARMVDGSAPMVAPVVDQAPGYARMREVVGIDAQSYLSVPIEGPDGELLGTLCAAGATTRGADLEQVLPTVQVQAGLLGTVLSHEIRLEREVRRAERAETEATTDALTGLANRRAWDAALAAEQSRSDRYASQACVLVVDLDAMKDVNDAAGHEAGDELLRRTAAVLRERVRGGDLLARLGGDEFGLLLVETTEPVAREVAQMVRELLAARGISASVGLGTRTGEEDLHAAWRAADAAMYDDKSAGGGERVLRAAVVRGALLGAAGPAAGHGAPLSAPDPSSAGSRARPLSSVDELLELVRGQLDMDVAYLSRLDGARRTFRNAVARGTGTVEGPASAQAPPVPVPGASEPAAATYCHLLAEGALEEVVPDTAAHPLMAAMPVTEELQVGSWVGVPVHAADGSLYGTLCAHSRAPDHRLRPRDAEVLRSVGRIVMDLVADEDRREDGRAELLTRLAALEVTGGPDIALQPVVALATGDVVGAEALSRFPAPLTCPAQWFEAAARAGVGTRLEMLALRRAVDLLDAVPGFLAVNASPSTVRSPGFTRLVQHLPLERLVVELTEHEAVADYGALAAVLAPLRRRGLRVAVDDAGAGFASMRHVLELAPDLVKLDLSLVRGIDTSTSQSAMVGALAGFVRSTGADLVAEGVETAAELEALRALGIGLGQGYHLGRPATVQRPTATAGVMPVRSRPS